MKYNFDEIIDRKKNFSAKYDEMKLNFDRDDLIPMWVADMDFKTAQPIIDAIRERVEQGIYGYTSRPDSYYDSVSQWLNKRHGWNADSKWMIHSPGVVPTLSLIIKEFTEPGDKIVIQSPVYYPFFAVVNNHKRELVYNPLKLVDDDYVMDYDGLEEIARAGAKWLILCNPHNPVGRVWKREELVKLGEICLQYGIRVISDEIHSDLIYENNKHIPFAMISEEFCKNTITCVAPSKTFNLAGLQASIAIFPRKEEREKFDNILGVLDIKRNSPFSLVATEAAYRYGEEWLEQLLKYIKGNIDYVNEYCKFNIPKLKPNVPQGTYLVWINCNELGMDNDELHKFMINKVKIAFDDGFWFGTEGSGYMRMNVACPRTVIEQALERLKSAIDKL
jgi:cystathionine beta-lyase